MASKQSRPETAFEPDPEIKIGDEVAYVHVGRDGKKMFLYGGKVKTVLGEGYAVEVDAPARVVEHDMRELGWTGHRWEYQIDTHPQFRPGVSEAPRKRGGVKRGKG